MLRMRREKIPDSTFSRYIGNRESLVYIVLFQAAFWLIGFYPNLRAFHPPVLFGCYFMQKLWT